MEGDALFWYQWEEQQDSITQWRQWKHLLRSFRPHEQEGLVEQWLAVRQLRRVAEYVKEFVETLTPL